MKLLEISTGWIKIDKLELDRHKLIEHQYFEIGDSTDLIVHYSLSIRVAK